MTNKKTLEDTVRGILTEQYKPMAQWEKEKKPTIDIGGHAHDPSGPNKSHIEEEELNEIPVNVPIGKTRSKKTSFAFNSLGGSRLRTRVAAQSRGNQRRNRYESFDYFAEEATKKVMKKLSEKDMKNVSGKTATGKQSDIIDTEPTKPELTGPTR